MSKEDKESNFSRIYLTLWGICLLVAIVFFALYKFGFRLSSELQPVKVGSVEVMSQGRDSQFFFDNREKIIVEKDGFFGIKNVTPGLHSLMVSQNGYWPWAKTFRVHANTNRTISVFMLPMDGSEKIIVSNELNEYRDAVNKIELSKVRQSSSITAMSENQSFPGWLFNNFPDRILSTDKTTALFVRDNTLYAGWISDTEPPPFYFCEENPCRMELPIVVPQAEIKSFAFYGDRRDIALFSAGTTIYAIEMDREDTQNFQPVYKGEDPYFYADGKDVLYIKDGNSILKAKL